MRFRVTPQRREFFDLFGRASANAVDIARLLVELFTRFPENGSQLVDQIKERELRGDELTHEVVTLLNRTFVTPFDRDDIYRLASAVDDICDFVHQSAGNLYSYGVTDVNRRAREQADVILRSAIMLDEAMQRLEGFKDSSRQLIELRSLEDEGDRLLHESIAELFRSSTDPLTVIRWKDIHEGLEEAVDACENAADVLEAILVKNR
jgi:predicted phosphate transport protein (TIGR00153 family)